MTHGQDTTDIETLRTPSSLFVSALLDSGTPILCLSFPSHPLPFFPPPLNRFLRDSVELNPTQERNLFQHTFASEESVLFIF